MSIKINCFHGDLKKIHFIKRESGSVITVAKAIRLINH